jgi:hypothetical protein
MNMREMLDAFTSNLSHEISDLGGSAATAKATISTLLAQFKNDFTAQIDGLDKAISDVLDGHYNKARALAEAAGAGQIVRPSQAQEAPPLDLPEDEATVAVARKFAPRKAA